MPLIRINNLLRFKIRWTLKYKKVDRLEIYERRIYNRGCYLFQIISTETKHSAQLYEKIGLDLDLIANLIATDSFESAENFLKEKYHEREIY